MHYNSDNTEWAYVLSLGETDVSPGYKKLMAECNRLEDIYCDGFKTGLTGDEMLTNILKDARGKGIPNPRIFAHSVGYFLHEPGPLIGLPWEQVSNPGRGDVKLVPNSCFTAELSVNMPVKEYDMGPCFSMGGRPAFILLNRESSNKLPVSLSCGGPGKLPVILILRQG